MRHGTQINEQNVPISFIECRQNTFGYMFPKLARNDAKVLQFNPDTLNALELLGEAVGSKIAQNDSSIPAGFTYLGQFIDHDITLDTLSSIKDLQSVDDVENLRNFRTPSLDLDSVYGRGPSIDPHLYMNNTGDPNIDRVKLLLGINTDTGQGGPDNGNIPTNFDLPRSSDKIALLGDPRNDENLIVSQLHHAFLKFHNAVVDILIGKRISPSNLFSEAKQIVIHHYQWIVLHQFLKTIAREDLVDDVLNGKYDFYKMGFIMPVEFSVGAFRFGHSMVRSDYTLNDSAFNPATMMQVFEFVRVNAPHGDDRLPVFSNWAIDFNRFFDTGSTKALNFAKKIDTSLSPALNTLPGAPAGFMAHLAKRNLQRSVALRVPYAQAITRNIGIPMLTSNELLSNVTDMERSALTQADLLAKTPLWYYILKEAEVQENGNRLGRLGSIIVVKTIVRILQENKRSILSENHKDFRPHLPRHQDRPIGDFDMTDLLSMAGVLS